MSGKRITNRQENLYMNKRQQGQNQETVAAKGGITASHLRRDTSKFNYWSNP